MNDPDVPGRRAKEVPGRRSTDVLAEQVDAFILKTERRLSTIFIGALISLSVIALTTAAALLGLGLVVKYNHAQAVKVEDIADRADARSQRTVITNELQKEKVCSQSSDRLVACRALFERLAGSLSEEQRVRLACQVVLHLRGQVARALRKQNPNCKVVKERHP